VAGFFFAGDSGAGENGRCRLQVAGAGKGCACACACACARVMDLAVMEDLQLPNPMKTLGDFGL
jgi:hypothetical protein